MRTYAYLTAALACFAPAAFAAGAATPPPPSMESGARVFDDAAIIELMDDIEAHLEALPQPTPSAEAEPVLLDAATAAAIALRQNPRAAAAAEDVEAASARAREARAAMLPQAAIETLLAYQDFDYTDAFGGGRFPILGAAAPLLLGGDQFAPDSVTRTDRFSVTQPLFAGGQLRAAAQAAGFLAEAEAWRREETAHEIALEAEEAYYDAVLAGSLVRVANASVDTFQRLFRDATELFEAGAVSRYEVMRAETELRAREADATAAVNARRLAHMRLRSVLALPQETPLTLAGTFTGSLPEAPPAELAAEALEARPALKALRQAQEAADANIRRARGAFLPEVGASVEWTHLDGAPAITPDGWRFSLGAQWRLFTGGQRRASAAAARAEARGLSHELREAEQLIELDVHQAYTRIHDAAAKVRGERRTVELAREGLRMAEIRFQEGAGTQSEVLEAELALTNAETSLVQALRDFSVANAALRKATGRPPLAD